MLMTARQQSGTACRTALPDGLFVELESSIRWTLERVAFGYAPTRGVGHTKHRCAVGRGAAEARQHQATPLRNTITNQSMKTVQFQYTSIAVELYTIRGRNTLLMGVK